MSATEAPGHAVGDVTSLPGPFGRPRRRFAVPERLRGLPGWLVVALGLLALTAFSAYLRTRGIYAKFWIDEGLSVGISDRPLSEIPAALKLDGAPPAFYLLLHLWMGVFGTGEAETHAMSLVFALLCIPTAFLVAQLLWGRREAWVAAGVTTVVPFLTYYAQETRMYALVVLLSLVVTGAWCLLFVQRRRRALPVLALALPLTMLTHNWALFLGTASGIAWLVLLARAARPERRGLLVDGVVAYGVTLALYAPWLPTLLYQAERTGAPWAKRPGLEQVTNGFEQMLGGTGPLMLILLGAGAGWWALAHQRRSTAARTTAGVAALLLGGLLVAFVLNQVTPAWANRYFAVLVGPTILLVASGFARGGRLGLVALAIALLFWTDSRTDELNRKSNAFKVAQAYTARLEPADQVVVTHPEQIGVMHYYLPSGLRWATSLGPSPDPRFFDWTDATDRLDAALPVDVAEPLIRGLEPGQRLLLVQPMIRAQQWGAPWTRLVRERAAEWERLLDRDRRLRRVDTRPRVGLGRPPRGVRGVLYVRR